MTTGSKIKSTDYNSIRAEVERILGQGQGTLGYGQELNSQPVQPEQTITRLQWDALRNDIINVKLHQDGQVPPIAVISNPIKFGSASPNNNFSSIVDQALVSRFKIGTGRSVLSTRVAQYTQTSWTTQARCTVTLTFGSSDQSRYFFNTGGKLRILASRSGGTLTAQNNAWTSLLSAAGARELGANVPSTVNFYNLTDSYKILFQSVPSSPYSSNRYTIEVKSNVSDNSQGTATILEFRITLDDLYVDNNPSPPEDKVDGTLSIRIEEFKATGSILNSESEYLRTFFVASPIYEATPIVTTGTPIEPTPVPPSITATLTAASTAVPEGQNAVFTVNTSNAPNGTILFWSTISSFSSLTSGDFTDSQLTGTVTINNNTGTITRPLKINDQNDPGETFQLRLHSGSSSGTILATSPTISIVDV
jgi:hypothetical protein